MSSYNYSAEDFKSSLKMLLPRGLAWSAFVGGIQDLVLSVYARAYEKINNRANQLLHDAFPANTVELLPEWEKTLALPDPDLPVLDTLQERQAMVVAKFIGLGGQSAAYYKRYAALFGYDIKVINYGPFRAGYNKAGDPLLGEEWAHIWSVTAKKNTTTYFRAGLSRAGEPLAKWNDLLLECLMRKVKPSHTKLIFNYTE